MLAIPLFLILFVWYLVVCIKWKKHVYDLMEKMPGANWFPYIGTFYSLSLASREDVIYKFNEISQRYGPFFRSWNGSIHEVHVMKAEHAQIILRSSSHTSKGPFYRSLNDWMGVKSILLSEGPTWFFQRKLLTPTFHFKILEGFTQIFSEKATELIEVLSKKADGSYFNALPSLYPVTLKAICETSFGVPLEGIVEDPLEYVKYAHDMTELAMWRYWQPWLKDTLFYLFPQGRQYRRALKGLHDFSKKVIAYKRDQRKDCTMANCDNSKDNRLSFMDLILNVNEKQQALTDEDIHRLVDLFTFAGFETTANSLGWILFVLGNNPHVQEKAYEEITRVLHGKEAPTTMEEVNELKYVDCIIKESLRLYPVLPFLTRKLKQEVEIDNYRVPVGTQVIVHIGDIHRDPKHFPEPNEFRPERFLPENSKDRHPFAFIPFSAGPRNCLGMRFALVELRILVASIINKFKIVSLESEETLRYFVHILMRPQTGIRIKLEKREGNSLVS